MSSARRVAFAMLASAVRRQHSGSGGASQSNVPPSSKLAYAWPRARSRLRRYRSAPRVHDARRRGTHAVRRALQLGEHFLEGPPGHLDARHGAGEWLHGAPSLVRAEAHLAEQLVGRPTPVQVRKGERQSGPHRQHVRSDIRAREGEEGLLRRGPEGPRLVDAARGQWRPPTSL